MKFDHLKHFTIEVCSNPEDGEFYQLRCDEPAHDNMDVDQNSTLLELAAVATSHWIMHVDDEQEEVHR